MTRTMNECCCKNLITSKRKRMEKNTEALIFSSNDWFDLISPFSFPVHSQHTNATPVPLSELTQMRLGRKWEKKRKFNPTGFFFFVRDTFPNIFPIHTSSLRFFDRQKISLDMIGVRLERRKLNQNMLINTRGDEANMGEKIFNLFFYISNRNQIYYGGFI